MEIKAKVLSLWGKIFVIVLGIFYNLIQVLKTGNLPSLDQQKSLLTFLAFIWLVLLPIDVSKIMENIFQKKMIGIKDK